MANQKKRKDTLLVRFARRIHALREEKNLSQEALASGAEMDPSYISALERHTKSPTLATMEKLAKGLKVDLADLVDFKESDDTEDDRKSEELSLIRRRLEKLDVDKLRRIRKALDAMLD